MVLFSAHKTDWMDEAKCSQVSDFTELPKEDAIYLCKRCPVIDECRRYAMSNGIEHEVWGGLTAHQRKRRVNQTNSKIAEQLGLTLEQLRDVLDPTASQEASPE